MFENNSTVPRVVAVAFPTVTPSTISQVLSLLKNLVVASEVPSTAERSAVTVTLPSVGVLGVRSM